MTARFWQGKTVLITGASSGIGRSLARQTAEAGARIGLVARRAELLAELTEEIRAAGGQAAWSAADVTDAPALTAAVARLETELGPCDVAVANAGVYRKTDGAALDPQAFAQVIDTNVNGAANLFAAVLPGMLARGSGRLAGVASIAGLIALPQAGAYCASKSALLALLRSLRLDLEPKGILVTAICPGFVDTPLLTHDERQTVQGIVTADEAARRIARAIQRGVPQAAFPWGLAAQARASWLLPWWLFRLVMKTQPPMEEA